MVNVVKLFQEDVSICESIIENFKKFGKLEAKVLRKKTQNKIFEIYLNKICNVVWKQYLSIKQMILKSN